MKIVLASSNAGKIKEFQALLKNAGMEIIPQSSLQVQDAEETGLSFIENAIIKARHASRLTGLPAIADDSGLAVAALNGAPGIYSSRYAGEPGNNKKNIEKLLHELKNTPDVERQASFHCVLAFMRHALDPVPLICHGEWKGKILHSSQGNQGFGYDPVFYVPSQNMTAAELPPDIKNKLSHRGQALLVLLKKLSEIKQV